MWRPPPGWSSPRFTLVRTRDPGTQHTGPGPGRPTQQWAPRAPAPHLPGSRSLSQLPACSARGVPACPHLTPPRSPAARSQRHRSGDVRALAPSPRAHDAHFVRCLPGPSLSLRAPGPLRGSAVGEDPTRAGCGWVEANPVIPRVCTCRLTSVFVSPETNVTGTSWGRWDGRGEWRLNGSCARSSRNSAALTPAAAGTGTSPRAAYSDSSVVSASEPRSPNQGVHRATPPPVPCTDGPRRVCPRSPGGFWRFLSSRHQNAGLTLALLCAPRPNLPPPQGRGHWVGTPPSPSPPSAVVSTEGVRSRQTAQRQCEFGELQWAAATFSPTETLLPRPRGRRPHEVRGEQRTESDRS